jgi:hypothetical protein
MLQRYAAFVCAFALLALAAARPSAAQKDGGRGLVGEWEGESVCTDKNRPACRDEHVVYRIAAPPDEKGVVHLSAYKVVAGERELMYELDFKYDPARATLRGEFERNTTRGVWEYKVEGDTMEGTLTILPAGTLGRRVKVKKKS